jgi:general secretion pathway protein L
MNLLRLYCPLLESPFECEWVLLHDDGKSTAGRSTLKDLPRPAERVQLIVPAPDVLITRASLPSGAHRTAGSVLAFAIEEQTVSEPDANLVSWLGTADDDAVLAVLDRHGLERWRGALAGVGIQRYEIYSEMLLLPWTSGEWSIAWTGQEGFARTGNLEAAAIDSGDRTSPPLSLHLMLDRSEKEGRRPRSRGLNKKHTQILPQMQAWAASLGLPIRHAGRWDWRLAAAGEGAALAQETPRWRGLAETIPKLRLAAWITGIALALHAIALVVDWTLLASDKQSLRRQMDARFRSTFPDAVAVVDPLLQMRRKLSEARHAAGQADSGDFLPMIEKAAPEMKDLPSGAVRVLSYEAGRMTLQTTALDEQTMSRIAVRMRQAGLIPESSSAAGRAVITLRVP